MTELKHPVTIRRAASSDYDGLYLLWEEFGKVFTKETLMRPLGIEWMNECKDEDEVLRKVTREFVSDPKHLCFVADCDGTLVGFISGCLNIDEDKVYDRKGYIEDWFVSETHRRRGVGRQLWDALLEEFTAQDCSWLELGAFASNPAIEFYKSQGFVNSTVKMVKKLKGM